MLENTTLHDATPVLLAAFCTTINYAPVSISDILAAGLSLNLVEYYDISDNAYCTALN